MNISDDGKTIKLKKDVVKNIAIVFLAIMLILTFFSNSIMNRSLPEVATESINSGTITEKIRGTGNVEAEDPYNVTVSETRKISSVAVNEGDDVTKGQVLFYFEDEESEELATAEKELEDLIYKYTVGALTGEMTDQAYHNATTGNVLSMGAYEARIEAAKSRVKTAQDNVDSLTRQIAVLDGSSDGYSGTINDAKLDLEKAQIELEKARTTYTELKATVDAGDGGAAAAQSEYELANVQYENAKVQYGSAKQKYDGVQGVVWTAVKSTSGTELVNFKEKYDSVATGDDIAKLIFGDDTIVVNANAWNDWVIITKYDVTSTANYNAFITASEDITKAEAALTAAKTNVDDKRSAKDAANSKAAAYYDAKSQLSGAESKFNDAKNRVDELQTYISSLTNDQAANSLGNKELATQLTIKKADAELELAKAKEDQTQLLMDISKTLDLTNQNSIIKEQQEKVEKLREKATGATVVAPVDGKVLTIGKKAGETSSASEPLATIQVTGKPMRLSITVTTEQAKKVNVGDKAELQNSWYYSDEMKITLTKIANDPNSPRKNKILMFNVEGDVVNGESLSISIGQRSREYDKVVPNSAIREDNRGKFIYIIEEKGTPFGNRYKAKRVDVEVLATDDTRTAINADVSDWSYVITTSNKPIEAGQQVRFVEK